MARVFYIIVVLLIVIGGTSLWYKRGPSQGQTLTTTSAVLAASNVTQDDNLQWMVGGIAQPFRQGGEVAVAGDVLASVTVDSSPVRRSQRAIDLRLYRSRPGNPIDDADVHAVVQMRYMDHGQFNAVALHSDGGHYLLPMNFAMPGEWLVDIVINTAGKQAMLQLDLGLFD